MATNADVAALGRLLASPARAAMLDALFDGEAWSVGELARAARVSTSTASEHLDLLRKGGLVASARNGRYCHYRLASEEVAHALECLGALAPPLRARGLAEDSRNEVLRHGRTCYDHLAGQLGVAVTEALVARGHLLDAADGFAPTAAGERALAAIGIDLEALRSARRPISRSCLDWSERRPHLAGGLGAALLGRLESVRGVERLNGSRAVRLRPRGRVLLGELGVDV